MKRSLHQLKSAGSACVLIAVLGIGVTVDYGTPYRIPCLLRH